MSEEGFKGFTEYDTTNITFGEQKNIKGEESDKENKEVEVLAISEILKNLYLGSSKCLKEDLKIIKEYKIKKLIKVVPIDYKNDNVEIIAIEIKDLDNVEIDRYFNQTYNEIEMSLKEGQNVLVMCAEGRSRSATIIIAYLMRKLKLSYEDAFNEVKKKRSIIDPNDGFRKRLKNYEQLLWFGYVDPNTVEYLTIPEDELIVE
jgi:dual specificity phosphatase 12